MNLEETLEELHMTYETIEDRIAAEYTAVRGWIALNPYWALTIATVAGWLIGKII